MLRPYVLAVMVGFALLACGCKLPQPDAKAEAAARLAYAQVHDGAFDALLALAAPSLKTPETKPAMVQLKALLPAGQPKSITNVGWNDLRTANAGETLSLTQEYDYGDRVVLVQSAVVRATPTDAWRLSELHAQVATQAELATLRFTLAGKKPVQYGFLAATILSPLLMLLAIVKVARTKGLRRKWLWIIISVAGLFAFHMNWATGEIGAQWLSIQFIGAGAAKSLSRFAPWVLTCTFPLGALLVLSGLIARPSKEPVEADAA